MTANFLLEESPDFIE